MNDIFQQKDPSFLSVPLWEKYNPSLVVGFTTRFGGYSQSPYDTFNFGLHVNDHHQDILANRNKLGESLGIPLNYWVAAEQTHGIHTHVVDKHDKGKGAHTFGTSIKDTDGLITKETGILCTAFFADCVPLYFYDPITSYIGITHAGWKGTTNKIGLKMVERLQNLGVNPENLLAVIGPSISQEEYEVDERVVNHIDEIYRENVTIKLNQNKYLLDLKRLNQEILLSSGLKESNIEMTKHCTYKEENLFFSHRRDQGTTGRMLGYIGLMQTWKF